MIKKRKKGKSNQGNSFIVVIATVSFLAVLTAALLVAVGLCFRLKAYDINSRDNFYYLEQAMDEIYETVGTIAMQDLNAAYDETAAVIVYFDPTAKSYVTMDNEDASNLMKATFVNKLSTDPKLSSTNIATTLKDKMTYKYDATSRKDGVQLSVGNVVVNAEKTELTIKDLVLKREAMYSTINTSKSKKTGASTFVQSITTDLTIVQPDFDVNFDFTDHNIKNLYDFVLISDMGVEINGSGTQSNILGNVYAAADFYNKTYNKSTDTAVKKEDINTRKTALNNKVSSYDTDKLKACDGLQEKSMYSGFYVRGATVSIVANKMIVPGSIAALSCANLDIKGMDEDGNIGVPANVWADGIVLGGYSRKRVSDPSLLQGSQLNMKADAYIYDDLEVNAAYSKFALEGNYFGYNYSGTDNREYSDQFNSVSGNRKFAHYNSSAVIVNGEEASLDLSKVDSMYIAGQAYVELTKSVAKSYKVTGEGSTLTTEEITDPDSIQEDDIVEDTYKYVNQDDDNYMRQNEGAGKEQLEDYKTGEALSIKSNQLAYISLSNIKPDNNGNLYVNIPSNMVETLFEKYWPDAATKGIPVIETVLSGNPYYFYDFSKAVDNHGANEFMEEYAELFEQSVGDSTVGESAGLINITDYDAFKVNLVQVDPDKVYSNSAISVKDGNTATIKVQKNSQVISSLSKANDTLSAGNPGKDIGGPVTPTTVTLGLQNQYKEMKMLLTDKPDDVGPDAVSNAYGADEGGITPINYYFNFNCLNGDGLDYLDTDGTTQLHKKFTELGDAGRRTVTVVGDSWKYQMGYDDEHSRYRYQLYLGTGDVKITADSSDGKVKGLVICKGDVTFDSNVKEFEGLIVSGGKVIVNHSVNFVSDSALVRSILRECDDSRLSGADVSAVCQLFRHFDSNYKGDVTSSADDIKPMKSISSVLYEDILEFKNWKKNVD